MRRYSRQVIALLCFFLIVLVVIRILTGNTYRVSISWEPANASDPLPELQVNDPEIAWVENAALEDGRLAFDVIPLRKGKAIVQTVDRNGKKEDSLYLSVTRMKTVYNVENGGFKGDTAVLILITLFLLLISAMMLHGFLTARGAALYAYSTMFYIGFFFFALTTGLSMMNVTLRHITQGDRYPMLLVYESLGSAAVRFLYYTSPLLLVFSLAMGASNIALLIHNRPRIQNGLGLITGLAILSGASFGIWLTGRDFSGSLMEFRIHETIGNVYCMAFIYFECILAGAVICGIRAVRHRVPAGRDAIIILGCWFRPDGTLPPLLRGRADRAIEYWRENREETGREAYFICSGGQGKDETMPEAEAIRAYLISRGIPEQRILTETKSKSTRQNLLFSRRVMEEHGLPLRCVYATTNYHVFRSGMLAARAGLDAEGISSRTKWWFWPNAFIRECAGLVANKWKQELILLLALATFFGLLSMTLVG